tara:strand:+ start:411 stop:614 length:204 start_codon:yes stop_codon:yes gene_type:complete
MKHFIITRGSARFGHRAESREQLEAKLEQHAKDYPNATPVSDISEGNLRDEWAAKAAAKDKKLFGQA